MYFPSGVMTPFLPLDSLMEKQGGGAQVEGFYMVIGLLKGCPTLWPWPAVQRWANHASRWILILFPLLQYIPFNLSRFTIFTTILIWKLSWLSLYSSGPWPFLGLLSFSFSNYPCGYFQWFHAIDLEFVRSFHGGPGFKLVPLVSWTRLISVSLVIRVFLGQVTFWFLC